MIRALLFDLDGVLFDGMALHEEAFLAALRAEGGIDIGVQEHRDHYAGLPTRKKLEALVRVGKLDARKVSAIAQSKQRLTQTYLEQRCTPNTDRINLLQHFTGRYQLGCVTNCIKQTTFEILRRTQLLPLLDAVVTNEDVKEPKPSPEPYQQACAILEVMPEEALVFEDHDLGMTAAFNAHCAAYQVKTYGDLTIETVWGAIQEANAYVKEGLS